MVHARDSDGNPVVMTISPELVQRSHRDERDQQQ